MHSLIEQMLVKYNVTTAEQKKNAIKEIMQEIVLCGLSRAGFFQKAAFYGGSALRIFYGLDRFSEDLDFSLIEAEPNFDLSDYFPVLEKEVRSYGMNVEIRKKVKTKDSAITSAFVKGNTREHILIFYDDKKLANSTPHNEAIKIKFEVDINPPQGAKYETRFQMLPSPYSIRLYDLPSLFAGKIHAVICRAWQTRIKGRDLYDYIFYLSHGAEVDLKHLHARLVDSKYLTETDVFDLDILKNILNKRFDSINYTLAKNDVNAFITDKASLDVWCPEFFKAITKNLHASE